ncbi:MAG: GTP-binding protein, partial [Actinomycetota bacterium]|nr:GTP-binding protein [Actinomycetota bacterium]
MNQRTKPTLDAVDAAWSSVLSTLRFARLHSKEEQPLQRQLDVTLLTGFLGSGKTTVLSHLLEHPGDLRIAVIVNDVGAVEVDAHLIRDMTSQQISLSNGCVCC